MNYLNIVKQISVNLSNPNGSQINKLSVYPLGQGQAIARLQPARAHSTSVLSQYQPLLFVHSPLDLFPAAQTTIKAEPTARNNNKRLIYLYRDIVKFVKIIQFVLIYGDS